MILGSSEFISANSFNFFDIVRNLLVLMANFLRVCAELISANLTHFLIPHSFILALFFFP